MSKDPQKQDEKVIEKDANPKLVVDVCAKCGKESRSGSMTSWIFGGKKVGCGCNTPSGIGTKKTTRQDSMQGVKTNPTTPRVTKPGKANQFVSNRYKIGDLIGVGGMGAVYKAYDPQLDKTFAVKILQSELAADPNAVKRFEQEASAMCGLTHANVVAVYDYGVSNDGAPYIVMDFLDGLGMDKILENESYMDPGRVVELFIQVADAVEHAHGKRVIHRDLKPSNIIVTAGDGELENVKIVDFGIAKIMPEGDRTTQGLTQTGELIGSPFYMSPEQCTGTKMDSRSDIYSIGCVMYECLSGKPPFEGENPIQTILHHLHDLPQALTGRFRNLGIPDTLNYIVMRCLEKHPSDRYQSAEELKKDLEAFKAGRPVEIVKPKRPQAKTRILNKLKVTSLVATTVASVALFGSLIAVGVGFFNPHEQLSIAERWKMLDTTGQDSFDRGEYADARKQFEEALELVEKSDSHPQLVLASLNELSDLARARNKVDEAKLLKVRVADLRKHEEAHTGDVDKKLNAGLEGRIEKRSDLEDLANNANDQIASLAEAHNCESASKLLEKVTRLTEEKIGPDSEVMIRCLHNKAYIQHDLGNLQKAIEGYNNAIEVERKVLPRDNALIANTLLLKVRAELQAGVRSYDAMDSSLKESLDTFSRIYGPDSPKVAWVRYHRGLLRHTKGDFDGAKTEIETAITSLNRDKEPNQAKLARCYSLLGLITHDSQYYKKALQMYEAETSKDYQFMVRTLIDYAALTVNDRSDLAISLLKRAEALSYQLLGEEQQEQIRSSIWKQMAIAFKRQGDAKNAEDVLIKSEKAARVGYGNDSVEASDHLFDLAKHYDDTREIDKARVAYKTLADALDRHKTDPTFADLAGQAEFRYQHFIRKLGSK